MKVLLHVLHAYTLQPVVPRVPSSLVEELAVIENGIGDCCCFITLLIIPRFGRINGVFSRAHKI